MGIAQSEIFNHPAKEQRILFMIRDFSSKKDAEIVEVAAVCVIIRLHIHRIYLDLHKFCIFFIIRERM